MATEQTSATDEGASRSVPGDIFLGEVEALYSKSKRLRAEQSRASNLWYTESSFAPALLHFALQVQAAFLATIFLFRVRRLRINRGLTRRPSKKVEAEKPAKVQALQDTSPAKNSNSHEDVETSRPRKRSRPPATPQESGVLLELLRKRRLCK